MYQCPVCGNEIDERKPEPRGSQPGPNRFRCVHCSWTWTEDALTENNAYLKIAALRTEYVRFIERLKQINGQIKMVESATERLKKENL
jgi:rubredoxin